MPSSTDFPARGKVIRSGEGSITFIPTNSNYELKLQAPDYAGPTGAPVNAFIRVKARRVWTVPSGGNFISPIFGPPKTIQGRILHIDQQTMVMHAGTPIIVELPANDVAMDLNHGPLREGAMVNVVAFSGATFSLAQAAALT